MAGQSMNRKISRGHVIPVWDNMYSRMDFYKKANNGLFILCHPQSGNFVDKGPGRPFHYIQSLILR